MQQDALSNNRHKYLSYSCPRRPPSPATGMTILLAEQGGTCSCHWAMKAFWTPKPS